MKTHVTLHKSGGKYYVYIFHLMEDAQIVDILKSSPLSKDEVDGMKVQDYVTENPDDFTAPYTIIKEKKGWKCNCPWGLYQSDRKPCWHVNEIPSVMLTKSIDEPWAEWAEESAKERRS